MAAKSFSRPAFERMMQDVRAPSNSIYCGPYDSVEHLINAERGTSIREVVYRICTNECHPNTDAAVIVWSSIDVDDGVTRGKDFDRVRIGHKWLNDGVWRYRRLAWHNRVDSFPDTFIASLTRYVKPKHLPRSSTGGTLWSDAVAELLAE